MRTDLNVDWEIPPTPAGWPGRLERFMGPGKSRSESAVENAGLIGCAAVLAAGVWSSGAHRDWSALELTIVVLAGLDLIGGVLTNATNAAKRWYHRQDPGTRRARLTFVGAHLLHLGAMGLIVLPWDWTWTLVNSALLLTGAVAVEFTALHLKRPLAMAVFMTAVLVNLFWLETPVALAWFAPLFFLKLLVCHLVPEAPLKRRSHHA
ncbi:hypothetical protein GCM10010232_38960 [Streptomyces amakusaensis]|uniref:Integral membrane protein n=1 Tax=Streptomyces amakusaensis TaxID=67271 RepID=A0ABW0APC5_9ACTN